MEALVLSLDFEKCFDKVSHSVITGALKYFGFSEYLIRWTETIYADYQAVIRNNGNMSDEIKLEKGICQGGPASSFYFLICAELLAIELRSDSRIQGIPIDDMTALLGQFADDIDIYLLNKQNSLDAVFDVLERFKKYSGFSINYDKTQVYRIGSLANTDARLYTERAIMWTNNPITVLGVSVHQNEKIALDENYSDMMVKIRSILKIRSHRKLSLMGKC